MRGDWIGAMIVLSLSIGCGTIWFVREKERQPEPLAPTALVREGAHTRHSDQRIESAIAEIRSQSNTVAISSSTREPKPIQQNTSSGASGTILGQRVEVAGNRTGERTAGEILLEAINSGDHETVQKYYRSLLDGKNASLPEIEKLLASDSWRVERMAMSLLHHIGTTEAKMVAIGHLVTRPEEVRRGWHRLAYSVGQGLDGDMVDLLVNMAEDAEGEAERRLLLLLKHARSEDALFRLYMIAEEHPDEKVRKVAIDTVYNGRRSGSIEILKDVLLTHDNPEVAAMAAVGLAKTGHSGAVMFLAETANGTHPESEVAQWALSQVHRIHGQGTLSRIANNPKYKTEVRLAAVEALGTNRRRRYTEKYLRKLAHSADSSVVRSAAEGYLEERAQ